MRIRSFSIRGLMGVVLVASIGLAALRSATRMWSGTMFLLTCAVLSLAAAGAVCRRDETRAWWVGFASFGWGYLILAFWSSAQIPRLPTMQLLDGWRVKVVAQPMVHGKLGRPFLFVAEDYYWQVGQCLWSLLFATVGGLLARALFARQPVPVVDGTTGPQPAARERRRPWLRPMVLILVDIVLILAFGLLGSRSVPVVWAAAPFVLTWGLLGFMVIGALTDRGRRRTIWLGAALFGAGYMILVFGRDPQKPAWPRVATEMILLNLRPAPPVGAEFPATSESVASANARIRKALERPIPLRFPNETPLEEVLSSIKAATKDSDGASIDIYVDPNGLAEAEKTMTSPIAINVEGVPLKTSLYLALKQLNLGYRIKGGLLLISEEKESFDVFDDSFLISGHCLLALVSAGIGGVLAPLVIGAREETAG